MKSEIKFPSPLRYLKLERGHIISLSLVGWQGYDRYLFHALSPLFRWQHTASLERIDILRISISNKILKFIFNIF